MEQQPQLPLDVPPSNIRCIEGGRAIAARNVQASFAVDTDAVSSDLTSMAGYYVVAWDDEGGMVSAYHCGARNPYSVAMLPELLRGRIASDIANGDTA